MNEFAFFKSQHRFSQDVDVGLDFTYDGTYQPAGDGAGFVRERVVELRNTLAAVQAGEAKLDQLIDHVLVLGTALETAVAQCRAQAARGAEKKDFYEANASAYEQGVGGLVQMQAAVLADDVDMLLGGMEVFEAAVQEVDRLVAEEESNA